MKSSVPYCPALLCLSVSSHSHLPENRTVPATRPLSSWGGGQIQFHKLRSQQNIHAGGVKSVSMCVYAYFFRQGASACVPRAFLQKHTHSPGAVKRLCAKSVCVWGGLLFKAISESFSQRALLGTCPVDTYAAAISEHGMLVNV